MADSDKNPFLDMFTDFGKSLNLPGPDIEGIMDYHRKNLQALQAATQIGSGTAQTLLEKQRKALEETLAEIAKSVEGASSGAGMTGAVGAPMEIARKALEAALQNSREVAEIVQKGNADAFAVLKDRVMESIEEMTGKTSGKS